MQNKEHKTEKKVWYILRPLSGNDKITNKTKPKKKKVSKIKILLRKK